MINYDEIEKRWKDIKEEVLDYFEGEVAENYIEHTEYALESSETLLKSLTSDYFLRTFFTFFKNNPANQLLIPIPSKSDAKLTLPFLYPNFFGSFFYFLFPLFPLSESGRKDRYLFIFSNY